MKVATDSPNDVAGRDTSGVWDVEHLDVPLVQPFLADAELIHQCGSSPVIAVCNVRNLLVLDEVNGHTTVFVPDVDDHLVHPLAGSQRLHPLTEREDGGPLVPSSKLVRVECYNHLAALGALLQESGVPVMEQVKRPADVDPH